MADPISLGITLALTAAQMAMTALRKIEGPRLEDLKVTIGDPGAPMNYFFGTRRFAGIPIFFSEDIREKKRRRKTKGGKFNDYTYYGTFAAVIADHAIDGVTRIWLDKHLVYDATSGGPITPIGTGDSVLSFLRIYLGTDTQEADPRMLATIEGIHGVGSCPAYRRIAYMMFEELPLEKFGNRIPQISVEAVSNGVPSYPYDQEDSTGSSGNDYAINPNGWMAYFTDDGDIEWWDLSTRTRLGTSPGGANIFSGSVQVMGIADDGVVYYTATRQVLVDIAFNLYTVEPLGVPVRSPDMEEHYDDTRAFGSGASTVVLTSRRDPGYYDHHILVAAEECARDFFSDQDGDVWGIFQPEGASSTFSLMNMTEGAIYPFTASTGRGDVTAARGCATSFGTLFVVMDGFYYAIDRDSMTIASSGAWARGTIHDILPFNSPGRSTWWDGLTEFSLQDGATIRTHAGGWALGDDIHTRTYDPVNHADLSRPQFNARLNWRYLDRLTGDGVTLASITAAICDRCGIEVTDYSVTALTSDIVDGYAYTQGQGHSILEPLLDLYGAFPRPHNFITEFKKRGGATAGTIDVTEFARDGSGPRYTVKPLLDTDLPRKIELTFSDINADQQPNVVVARRPLPTVDGVGENSYGMQPWSSDADTARNLVETYMRGLWNRNEIIENGLTAQRLALEPGDTWNLGLDGDTRTATVQKLTISASDVLKLEWEKDFAQLATLPDLTAQPRDGHAPAVLNTPIISKGFVLDIPLIRDSDDDTNPVVYEGAGPYAPGFWPGAIVYEHDGDDYNIESASIGSTFDTTWGQATTTLANASYFVWDRGNTVTVLLNNGTLASATESACNLNPRLNLALLGNELIQFTTATLTGTNTYQLSGLKRGRRGTEWATGTHTSSDRFVMMEIMAPVEMGAGDIGNTLLFKAVTQGMDVEAALEISIAYTGASNMPWAPAQFRAVKEVSGDWTFTWRRRSRVAGDFAPYSPALGESTENYDVNIYRAGFGAASTRTITATSQTATYTAAQQVTDGGAVAVGDLDAGVLQVGDLADGFETQVSF